MNDEPLVQNSELPLSIFFFEIELELDQYDRGIINIDPIIIED